jgi:hypothetical protein
MKAYNLINLSAWYQHSLADHLIDRFVRVFLTQVKITPLAALTKILSDAGNVLEITTRQANALFANCVLRLKIKLDLSQKLEYHQPVPLL